MACINISQKALIRSLKEELGVSMDDSLAKELIKIITTEIKLWNGDIGEGKELRNLYKTLNNYEF